MKFGRNGAFRVNDEAVANAIRQEVGMAATVTRFENPHPADTGHHYMFTSPGMPWHKYDENGKRILEVEDAAEEGTEQESNQQEYILVTAGGQAAETGGSNSLQQGGQVA